MSTHNKEALAASEPVEAGYQCRLRGSDDPWKQTFLSPENWPRNPGWEYRTVYTAPPAPEQPGKGEADELGRFGHHPDAAIDFEIEVQSLEARLFDAQHSISKMGTQPEQVADVLAAIQKAMTFRVGGVESCVRAKATLRELEAKATPQPSDPAEGDAVRSLPALWRTREHGEQTEFDKGYEQASDECADALEAALSTPPTAAVSVDEEMVAAPFGFVATTAARQLRDVDVCTIRKERSAAYSIPVYTTPQSVVSVDEAMVRFESAMRIYMEDHDAECLDPSEEFIRRVTMHGLTAALDPQVKK